MSPVSILASGSSVVEPRSLATGVTAPSSVSPVRIRTARSSGRTKILPSPTSPVLPPSQSASIVGWTNASRDRDLEPDLLGERHLHGRAAVGLDPLELAAVALDAADRDAAHLGAVERLEHVVGLLGPDDADHQLHVSPFRPGHGPGLLRIGASLNGGEVEHAQLRLSVFRSLADGD